ncbi:acyltransferase family protein [Pseudomonas protegens]|uniref:acyltransferase family protein n=1 Tax=Pseudomonas protegens TaxID=380021 RepID=UPI00381DAA9B
MKGITRYGFTFLPVLLIAIQSYYKIAITAQLSTIFSSWPEGPYWAIRAALFVWFIAAVFKMPASNERPARMVDAYQAQRSERDPLLGLRALACANVIMGHWFMVVFGSVTPAENTIDLALRYLLSFSPWGGVWMFFTLSGYLMGKGFASGRHTIDGAGLKKFYRNRMLRIFPIYFVAVLLVGVLIAPGSIDIRTNQGWDTILAFMLFDVHDNALIGALWSVSTEFQFYLIAPVLFLILSKIAKNLAVILAATAVLLFALGNMKFHILGTHPELWHDHIYYPLISNIDCFVVGMFTAILANRAVRAGRYVKHGMVLAGSLTVAFQVFLSSWSFPEMASYAGFPGSATRLYYLSWAPAVTAVCVGLIIYLFDVSMRQRSILPNWFWRISTTGGLLTYCIYVFHEPVIMSIRRLYPATLSIKDAMYAFPVGLALILIVAYVFYESVEKRFDSKRQSAVKPDTAPFSVSS